MAKWSNDNHQFGVKTVVEYFGASLNQWYAVVVSLIKGDRKLLEVFFMLKNKHQ